MSYLVDFALADSGDWRLMLGIPAVPTLAVVYFCLRLPDTPRWYMMKGRRDDAARVMARIDPDSDVEESLRAIEADLNNRRTASMREMFRRPYLRATTFVIVYGLSMKLTGSTAIGFYGPTIYKTLGLRGHFTELIVPALTSVVGLAATLWAARRVDRIGRRPLLLIGMATMIGGYVLMMIAFGVGAHGGALTFAVFGFILFYLGQGMGLSVMIWLYAAESFPTPLRSQGSALTLGADEVAGLIIAQFFLAALNSFGGVGTFGLFVGLCAVALVFFAVFAPETKGRDLEKLHEYWENGGRWPDEAPELATPTAG